MSCLNHSRASYCFEVVELFGEDDVVNRHYQNYLALCPNDSAMFRHANGVREDLRELFESMEGDNLEVVLGQQDHTIYFTKTHRQGLLTALSVDKSFKQDCPDP